MEKLLEMRFKRDVIPNRERMNTFSQQLKNVKIIRSIELVAVAYKLGWLDNYRPKQKSGKDKLLDSVLWATKYNGCAVTNEEIAEMIEFTASFNPSYSGAARRISIPDTLLA